MIISSAARNFSPLLYIILLPNICFLKFVQIFPTDVSHDSLYISILAEYYAWVCEEYFNHIFRNLNRPTKYRILE